MASDVSVGARVSVLLLPTGPRSVRDVGANELRG